MTSTRRPVHVILAWLFVGWSARVCWLLWGYFLGRRGYRIHLVESSTMILLAAGLLLVSTRRSAASGHAAFPRLAGEPWPRGGPTSWLRSWRVGLAYAALALALYWPALHVGFLSDDFVLSAWARAGGFVRHAETGLFRPVPLALWAAVFAALGVSPTALHLCNVLLHGVNAALVAGLAVALGLSAGPAIAAGLLFLTFPAAAEAVVWCSGMQDVLMTTCALGAVLACLRSATTPAWAVVALLCAVLGLGVKETAVAVPVLCLIVVWGTPVRRSRRTRRVLAAMFLLSAGYAVGRATWGIASTYWRRPTRYFIKELLVQPVATLATPWRATTLADHPAVGIVTGTLLLGLIVACALTWTRDDRRFHVTTKMFLWALAAVVPVYAYLHITATLEGSRYVYLGAAGWAVALAAMTVTAVAALPSKWSRGAGIALAAVALLAWAGGLRNEVGFWRRAGALRDGVLREAALAARAGNCARVSLDNVPDSLDGAFVFRNGLAEALALRGLPPLAARETVPPPCVFRWTGKYFVVVSDGPAGAPSP